jgi:hypothetical protein
VSSRPWLEIPPASCGWPPRKESSLFEPERELTGSGEDDARACDSLHEDADDPWQRVVARIEAEDPADAVGLHHRSVDGVAGRRTAGGERQGLGVTQDRSSDPDRRPTAARLIQKWLTAGVSEEGTWAPTEKGTPQGAVKSPLLANVYLQSGFDL